MEDKIKKRLLERKVNTILNKDKAEMLGVSNQGALDSETLTVKGDKASADVSPKKMKETSIRDYIADKKMMEAERGRKEIQKRAPDILKSADVSIEREDRKALRSLMDAASKAGDRDTMQAIVDKVTNAKAAGKFAKTLGKKAMSAVPFVGGIATALMQQDASAMIPDEIMPQSVNQPKDELFRKLEQGTITDEERLELIKRSREQQ